MKGVEMVDTVNHRRMARGTCVFCGAGMSTVVSVSSKGLRQPKRREQQQQQATSPTPKGR